MTDKAKEIIYQMLCMDLQFITSKVPSERAEYLKQLIDAAEASIGRWGITLDETLEENLEQAQAVEMYAAYLYRNRAEGNNGMPEMLRHRLNQLLFNQKMKEEAEDATG